MRDCPECSTGRVECDCTGGIGRQGAADDCPACGGSGVHTCPACNGAREVPEDF